MMPKLRPTTIFQLVAILAIALALKYHYSTASPNGLRWILAPTTFLVETVTSQQFRFEPYAGYLSDDRTFLIAASCAGVNFLIIAFAMLNFGKLLRERSLTWRYIAGSLAVAYLSTLVANTVRIVVALYLQKLDIEIAGFAGEELHRLGGIVVYFGFLLLLFVVSEKLGERRQTLTAADLARRSLLPLAIYYIATLGIPIIRGAYRDAEFWQHSVLVALVPLMLLLPLLLLTLRRGDSSAKSD